MACCAPEMPVWAIAAAPPAASSRFLGLAPDRAAARPSAPNGVILSIVVIHLGICGSSPPWGRPRSWRTATRSNKMPRPILTQLTHVAGAPDLLAPPVPAMDKKMAPTMPKPTSQPRTNASPFHLARSLVSMRITAMIGIGLSAIPTANGSDPPMACPITPPRLGCPAFPYRLVHARDGSVTHEGHARLGSQVGEGLAADVDRRALDRAAGEGPGRLARVVVGDRLGAVLADVEPLPGDGELAWLGLDATPPDFPFACMQGQGALGWHRVALALEGGRDDYVADRQRLGRLDDLLKVADEVVGVLELAVLDVQGVAAEPGPMGEQDSTGVRRVDGDLDRDRVRAVADVRRHRFGDLGRTGIVHIAVPRLGQLGPVGG